MPVGLADLVQPEAVGEERGRVEAAGLHHRDEPAHPLLAAGAQRGDDPVVAEPGGEGRVRQLELAGVHAEARQRAAGPQRAQRALERLLRAEGLDGDVRPEPPVSRLTSSTTSTLVKSSIDVGAHPLRHREPDRVAVDADDQGGAHQLGAGRGAQADRALGEHDDGVADPHAARLRAGEAGRRDVGEQDDLLVGHAVGDLAPGWPAPTARAGTRPARRRSCCRSASRRWPRSRRRGRTGTGGPRGRRGTGRTG